MDPAPSRRRADYLQLRFGSPDQRFVDRLERRRLRDYLRRLPALRTCLDAPCGYGRVVAELASVERLVCVDRKPHRLQAAAAAAPDAACLRVDLAQRWPFSDAAFDLVVCLRFLHHLRQPEARAQVVAEALRVAGRALIVSYYAPNRVHRLQRRLLGAWRGRSGADFAGLTPAALAAEVAGHGARVVHDAALLPGLHAQRLALVVKDA